MVHFVVDVATSQQKVHVMETLNETCWAGLTGSNAAAEPDAPASVRTLALEPPSVHCIVDGLEFSMTVCHGPEGHRCEYVCDSGYVAEGAHVCSGDGHFGGGRCALRPWASSPSGCGNFVRGRSHPPFTPIACWGAVISCRLRDLTCCPEPSSSSPRSAQWLGRWGCGSPSSRPATSHARSSPASPSYFTRGTSG